MLLRLPTERPASPLLPVRAATDQCAAHSNSSSSRTAMLIPVDTWKLTPHALVVRSDGDRFLGLSLSASSSSLQRARSLSKWKAKIRIETITARPQIIIQSDALAPKLSDMSAQHSLGRPAPRNSRRLGRVQMAPRLWLNTAGLFGETQPRY